jgi:hypothetical protein
MATKYSQLELNEESTISLAQLKEDPSVKSVLILIEQHEDDTHEGAHQHGVVFGDTPNVPFLGHLIASKMIFEDPAYVPLAINAFIRGTLMALLNTLVSPNDEFTPELRDKYNSILNDIVAPTHMQVLKCLCSYGFLRFCSMFKKLWHEDNPGKEIRLDDGPYCTEQLLKQADAEMAKHFGDDASNSHTLH